MNKRVTLLLIVVMIIVASAVYLSTERHQSATNDPNTETLAGVDADSDGVRDDVQKWIDSNFTDETTRLALQVGAKGIQQSLFVATESELQAIIDAGIASSKCLSYDLVVELDARVLNTSTRVAAYDATKLKVKSSWINDSRSRYPSCSLSALTSFYP